MHNGKIAFLFTGQGSQRPGMGNDFLGSMRLKEVEKHIPGTEEILAGDKERIDEHAAYAVSSVSLMLAGELKDRGVVPDTVAGFSLGEISALIFSRVLSQEDGFGLLKVRTEAMKEAAEGDEGVMYAVNGVDSDTIIQTIERFPHVYAVNFNSPLQTVISGDGNQCAKAAETLKGMGAKTVMLNVAGAFHSPYMKSVSERIEDFLSDKELKEPDFPLYSNVTGDIYPYVSEEGTFRSLIARQASEPVQFVRTVENMINDGVTTFIEVGYGKTLSGLIARIAGERKLRIYSVSSVDTANSVAEAINTGG